MWQHGAQLEEEENRRGRGPQARIELSQHCVRGQG